MANLFQLATEYNNLYNRLIETADVETGEVDVDISTALEQIQGTFEEKAIATATVFRMLDAESKKIAFELERLSTIKKHIDKEQDRVKNWLKQACETARVESLKGMYANISFKESERTIIDNEAFIPKEFIRVKTTYEPDKTAIKAAINAGREVPGAHIETKRNIQIK